MGDRRALVELIGADEFYRAALEYCRLMTRDGRNDFMKDRDTAREIEVARGRMYDAYRRVASQKESGSGAGETTPKRED